MPLECALLLLWCGVTVLAVAPYPEHKIHNIVLYPDKHSWCKTTEIKQIVTFPGCNSVEIDNNVCVGACFSYSIPRSSPSAPGEVITPYCDSCQPQNFTWQEVKLTCEADADDEEDTPVEMTKKVQIINNCICASCEKLDKHSENHKLADAGVEDVPELMSLMLQQSKDDEEVDEDKEESTNESVTQPEEKQEIDNIIDVDEEKQKLTNHHDKEENKLELVQVNKIRVHHEEGPHHSSILKPDVPDHSNPHNHHRHHQEDEEVPSLLKNQFKVHVEDEEFPDQIAVESNKEEVGHVLSVPELIFKENTTKENSSETGMKIVEVSHNQFTPAVDGAHLTYVVKPDVTKE